MVRVVVSGKWDNFKEITLLNINHLGLQALFACSARCRQSFCVSAALRLNYSPKCCFRRGRKLIKVHVGEATWHRKTSDEQQNTCGNPKLPETFAP
jgi:hypothetical protein